MKKTILTILAGAGCALASCAQPAPSGNYSLSVTFPAEAEELFEAAEENAKWRYAGYQRLSKMEY